MRIYRWRIYGIFSFKNRTEFCVGAFKEARHSIFVVEGCSLSTVPEFRDTCEPLTTTRDRRAPTPAVICDRRTPTPAVIRDRRAPTLAMIRDRRTPTLTKAPDQLSLEPVLDMVQLFSSHYANTKSTCIIYQCNLASSQEIESWGQGKSANRGQDIGLSRIWPFQVGVVARTSYDAWKSSRSTSGESIQVVTTGEAGSVSNAKQNGKEERGRNVNKIA